MVAKAAFIRVERALIRPSPLSPASFYVMNQQEFGQRLGKLGSVLLARGLSLASPLGEAKSASKLAWSALRGMSFDRFQVLSEELFERQLEPSLRLQIVKLIEDNQALGYEVVLISELPEEAVLPLQQKLKASHLIANKMEVLEQKVTGRLLDPIVAQLSGQWLMDFAKGKDIDLQASRFYGSLGGDALLLSAVGEPCALHPDWRLKKIAREHRWPILERDT